MFTKLFWKDAAERVISTAVQAFLAVAVVGGFDILSFDWTSALSVAAGAALLSLLKAVVAATKSDTVSPASLVVAKAPELPAVDPEANR